MTLLFSGEIEKTPFFIRPLASNTEEIEAVAMMHCSAYRNQFYNPEGPLNGALGKAFPVLERYETLPSFRATWNKLSKLMSGTSPTAYAFVAFLKSVSGWKPVGFVKGGEWGAGEDMYLKIKDVTDSPAQVAELGSIYVDPRYQSEGVGRILVGLFASEARNLGYRQMITRAYAKNISPQFFAKTGGLPMGACEIPYGYNEKALELSGLKRENMPDSIPGVWLYWPEERMRLIADTLAPEEPTALSRYLLRSSLNRQEKRIAI